MNCLSSNFTIFLKSHKNKQKAYSDFTHDSSEYAFFVFIYLLINDGSVAKFLNNYSLLIAGEIHRL